MKNYLKLMIAVAAITVACFGSITKSSALRNADGGGHCSSSNDDCGKSPLGNSICGTYHSGDNLPQ